MKFNNVHEKLEDHNEIIMAKSIEIYHISMFYRDLSHKGNSFLANCQFSESQVKYATEHNPQRLHIKIDQRQTTF